MDPRTSGAQTRALVWWVLNPWRMAVKVLTLKKTVPISCTSAASQSIRRGSQEAGRRRRRGKSGANPCSTLTASKYCR